MCVLFMYIWVHMGETSLIHHRLTISVQSIPSATLDYTNRLIASVRLRNASTLFFSIFSCSISVIFWKFM